MRATISGSFRMLDEIHSAADKLKKKGVVVLSPRKAAARSKVGDFVLLKGDKGSPGEIERAHLEAIARSDFLYVVNPKGEIGPSVALEIGFAIAIGVPVFSQLPPRDEVFKHLVKVTAVNAAPGLVERRPTTDRHISLPALQRLVGRLSSRKGFDTESLTDKMVLLTEELGELANAVRMHEGLKSRQKAAKVQRALEDELSDCLIYLADMANRTDVELSTSVGRKLASDLRRKWRSSRQRRGSATLPRSGYRK